MTLANETLKLANPSIRFSQDKWFILPAVRGLTSRALISFRAAGVGLLMWKINQNSACYNK
jgi:hypothetical protein